MHKERRPGYSRSAASFCRDSLQPVSLSSGRMPAESAADTRVELMHLASHVVRRKPGSYGVRVKKGLIDGFARRFYEH
jgi:hypothetical protein